MSPSQDTLESNERQIFIYLEVHQGKEVRLVFTFMNCSQKKSNLSVFKISDVQTEVMLGLSAVIHTCTLKSHPNSVLNVMSLFINLWL